MQRAGAAGQGDYLALNRSGESARASGISATASTKQHGRRHGLRRGRRRRQATNELGVVARVSGGEVGGLSRFFAAAEERTWNVLRCRDTTQAQFLWLPNVDKHVSSARLLSLGGDQALQLALGQDERV